ncbi:MAG: VCBS repeat-containing protein [Candidatus Kerfeldbacteria bacterium]|nr:VCBS repeat-containing protein [Candidatus Kerfeldbacteria bacterium]
MPELPNQKLKTAVRTEPHVHIGQRLALGLTALTLGILSLSLGLAFLLNPLPESAFLVAPLQQASTTPTTATAVTLTWTAPGNDGNIGQGDHYDLRYSLSPITAATFDTATATGSLPSPQMAGSTESYSVSNLTPSTTYFFALKTYDQAGNVSLISNIATATTTAPSAACTPTYQCTDWSACVNGSQTRTCIVTNGCASTLGEPVTSQTCTTPVPPPAQGGETPHITNHILAVGTGKGSSPLVRIVDPTSRRVIREIQVGNRQDKNGVSVAVGDIDGDHKADIVVGTGPGSSPLIRYYSPTGKLVSLVNPFPTEQSSGVSVAVADVNGDGIDDVVAIPSKSTSQLKVLQYQAKTKKFVTISQIMVFLAEIAVTPRVNSSTVRVVRLVKGKLTVIKEFQAYALKFSSGMTLAIGDVNGDGRGEILTSGGPGYWSNIAAFTLAGKRLFNFLPASTSFTGGVSISSFDVDGDGRDEIITGTYSKGDPGIRYFRFNGLNHRVERIASVTIYPLRMQFGLRLGVG